MYSCAAVLSDLLSMLSCDTNYAQDELDAAATAAAGAKRKAGDTDADSTNGNGNNKPKKDRKKKKKTAWSAEVCLQIYSIYMYIL
jgi:prophage tail gpP-like protein